MLREQLKSKIHRARVTDGNVDYQGSITIPADLMEAVDLWEGEKVLVVSITSGARLETYAQEGPRGSGAFVLNGGTARLIDTGDRITILAFAHAREPVVARKIVCDEDNQIASASPNVAPLGL
ncbi:MAG: aspartate 1-decarboxylase [Phycisphaerae bacterium]